LNVEEHCAYDNPPRDPVCTHRPPRSCVFGAHLRATPLPRIPLRRRVRIHAAPAQDMASDSAEWTFARPHVPARPPSTATTPRPSRAIGRKGPLPLDPGLPPPPTASPSSAAVGPPHPRRRPRLPSSSPVNLDDGDEVLQLALASTPFRVGEWGLTEPQCKKKLRDLPPPRAGLSFSWPTTSTDAERNKPTSKKNHENGLPPGPAPIVDTSPNDEPHLSTNRLRSRRFATQIPGAETHLATGYKKGWPRRPLARQSTTTRATSWSQSPRTADPHRRLLGVAQQAQLSPPLLRPRHPQ